MRYSRWSLVVTETARTPILRIWPKRSLPTASVTAITSPGLIDLSIKRMMPAIRLPKVFCRPKPIAKPNAPENTASAVKSMPRMSTPTKNAALQIRMVLIFSASRLCDWSKEVKRRSSMAHSRTANHAAAMTAAKSPIATIASHSESRMLPTSIAKASKVSTNEPAASLCEETASRSSSAAATPSSRPVSPAPFSASAPAVSPELTTCEASIETSSVVISIPPDASAPSSALSEEEGITASAAGARKLSVIGCPLQSKPDPNPVSNRLHLRARWKGVCQTCHWTTNRF